MKDEAVEKAVDMLLEVNSIGKDIEDVTDFALSGKEKDLKSLLYDWNRGDDVEDDIQKILRPGLSVNDLRKYLDFYQ